MLVLEEAHPLAVEPSCLTPVLGLVLHFDQFLQLPVGFPLRLQVQALISRWQVNSLRNLFPTARR